MMEHGVMIDRFFFTNFFFGITTTYYKIKMCLGLPFDKNCGFYHFYLTKGATGTPLDVADLVFYIIIRYWISLSKSSTQKDRVN